MPNAKSKNKINLSGQLGWFYIIQLSHNGKWGFGITTNPELRLRKGYCNPSAEKQTFCKLYYGKYSQIRALERHLKNQWKSKMLTLYNHRLEWLDPKHNITGNEISEFVENRCIAVYPEIYRVKSDFLPYEPSHIFKNIKESFDKFLETI